MELLLWIIIQVLFVFLLFLWILYSSVTQKYSYWSDLNVPYVKASFPFGSMKDLFLGKTHMGQFYENAYKTFQGERYFGMCETRRPILVVRDPELIKHILTKDFQYFTDRFGFPINTKVDYISGHLFNMSGLEWKSMRMKLTPTFTSGKMKMMFLLMAKCGEQLRDYVHEEMKNNPLVDVKDVLTRFTMDVIATCAFGLEINSLSDKNCEFYYYGMKIFQPTTASLLRRIMFSILPFMSKLITQRFSPAEVSEFLTRIVRNTVEYREKNNVERCDFLDLLIKIRQNQSLLEDEKEPDRTAESEQKNTSEKSGLTIEQMTAQAFIFFAAGFETASSTMTFFLYELACNEDIQEKLHQEVAQVLEKHGGKPTYQAIQEMTYMDQVINETLRRYASLAILNRTCTKPYKVPDSELIVEKGQRIVIPTYAIHHDPEYYPEPFKFDPERFTADRLRERHPYIHLPFGEGPRMCIGMRFGLIQTKIGLTEMVSNFKFGLTPDTEVPVSIHKRSFVTQPEKPIILRLTKR